MGLTTQVPQSSTGQWTSKSKAAMGIPEDKKVHWAAMALSAADTLLLQRYQAIMQPECRGRGGLQRFTGGILEVWFEDNREEIEREVAAAGFSEKTDEDMMKELIAAETKIARLNAELETRRRLSQSMIKIDEEIENE